MNDNFQLPVNFPENVMLMDVALLNREVASMHRSMSWGLKRELPLIDMIQWITCLGLDGDVTLYGQNTQVIFVHESPETRLSVAAQPDFLHEDGASFFVPEVNKFDLSSVHPAGFTDTSHLYFDLMHILLDSKDVKNLMLLYSPDLYGPSVRDELLRLAAENGPEAVSKACLYEFGPAALNKYPYRQVNVIMSLAHVFGIKREDVE